MIPANDQYSINRNRLVLVRLIYRADSLPRSMGKVCRITLKVPYTFVSNCARSSKSVCSSQAPRIPHPAQLFHQLDRGGRDTLQRHLVFQSGLNISSLLLPLAVLTVHRIELLNIVHDSIISESVDSVILVLVIQERLLLERRRNRPLTMQPERYGCRVIRLRR
jgi:hypothetical protein